MKKILFILCFVFCFSGYTQTDTYTAVETFVPAYEGFSERIIINAATGEKAALIGGKNTNVIGEKGSMQLFSYDSATKISTQIFDFDMPGWFANISVKYVNNDVYIAFVGQIPHPVTGQRIKIWKAAMDGNANFVEIFSDSYAFENNTITDVDIDNDGDIDYLVGGFVGGTGRSNGILRNNGDDTFTRIAGPTEIPGVNSGDYESGFLDNSGKQHIVYAGGISGVSYSSVYEIQNDGTIIEVFDLGQGLHSSFPMIQIVDIDNDGMNDISIASLGGVKIYRNLGNLNFQLIDDTISGLPKVFQSVAKYYDMNNDGLLDCVVAGAPAGGNPITKIYYQSAVSTTAQTPIIGSMTFQTSYQFMIPDFVAPGFNPDLPLLLGKADLDFYDVDNDGNMDVLFSGNYGNGPANLAHPLTVIMVYEETLSVDTFTAPVAVKMYPNPASSMVSFSFDAANSSFNEIQSIDIFTLTGKKVLTSTIQNIDVTELTSGMYLVRIATNNGIMTKKLIKQ